MYRFFVCKCSKWEPLWIIDADALFLHARSPINSVKAVLTVLTVLKHWREFKAFMTTRENYPLATFFLDPKSDFCWKIHPLPLNQLSNPITTLHLPFGLQKSELYYSLLHVVYFARLVYRKFVMTTKVAETRGCQRCCVGRNPYNGYKYLCGILPTGIFLMQWYDPLNKFMLLKVCRNIVIVHKLGIRNSTNTWIVHG